MVPAECEGRLMWLRTQPPARTPDTALCPHVSVGVTVKVGDPPPFLDVQWTNGSFSCLY